MRAPCLVASLLLAGCAFPAGDPISTAAGSGGVSRPIVIALLDSGSLPYLPVFEMADDSLVTQTVPSAASVLLSSEGTPQERASADREVLDALELGTLYHFRGTRLLTIGFEEERPQVGIDAEGHGTGVTYLAALSAPQAIIVSVQTSADLCPSFFPTCIPRAMADGMDWIADQDWIDVVSVSLGWPGNPPPIPIENEAAFRYIAAIERAAQSGKLVLNGAGNTVTSPLTGYSAGPPWVISVGGFEVNASGESVYASKAVDVVANWTEHVPRLGGEEYNTSYGTSLATPIVAATLASALDLVRRADPERVTTTQELRDALNATATHVAPTSWKPVPPPYHQYPVDPIRASLPVLMQPQMGWGYVHAGLAEEIARRVLEGDFTIPAQKEQASHFQPAYQRAREEFWAAYR